MNGPPPELRPELTPSEEEAKKARTAVEVCPELPTRGLGWYQSGHEATH